jgi:hypothetical protein
MNIPERHHWLEPDANTEPHYCRYCCTELPPGLDSDDCPACLAREMIEICKQQLQDETMHFPVPLHARRVADGSEALEAMHRALPSDDVERMATSED